MSFDFQFPAPVKINLFLHILGRRDDGLHELQTVFQLLDTGDTLSFKCRNDSELRFTCSDPQLQVPDNLVVKAARLLRAHIDGNSGADIHLEKAMPVGGGIGGGSSDAATALLALNYLWDGRLELGVLEQLGQSLGADVPVFVRGRSAWAEGVGERLQVIELPELYYLVLTPKIQVSTTTVFTHPQLTRDSAAITVAAFFEQDTPTQIKGLTAFSQLRNDCQSLVMTLYPEVAAVIDWLGEKAPAKMTGTGASVFAPFETETAARKVLAQSPWPGFVARGINRSPVHGMLEEMLK